MINVPKSRLPGAEASLRVAASPPSGLGAFGRAAFGVGTQIKRQGEAAQLAEADLQAAERLNATRLEFEQDNNFSTLAARQAQAHEGLRTEIAEGLPDHLRAGFEQRFRAAALGHETAITRRAHTLRTDDGRARVGREMAEYFRLAIEAPDPEGADAVNVMLAATLADGVEAGLFTEAESQTLALAHRQKFDSFRATRLYNDDPAALEAALEAGEFDHLDPLEAEQMRARAGLAAERREALTRKEIESDLSLIEAARANGSVADNEAEVLARAEAAGLGGMAIRSVQRGRLMHRIVDMPRAERNALLGDLRAGGVSDPADVRMLEFLADLEAAAIKDERARVEKLAERTRKALEKQGKAAIKEANKRIDENLKAITGENPVVLDDLQQARADAHALGRADEFEAALEVYGLHVLSQSLRPGEMAAKIGGLPAQHDLRTARAQQRLIDRTETRLKAESDRLDALAAETRKAIEKQGDEARKEANKRIDANLKAMSGENPLHLDDLEDARRNAHALGRGMEFEEAFKVYILRSLVGEVPPRALKTRLDALPPVQHDLATARAQKKLADRMEAVAEEIEEDPIGFAAARGSYGPLAVDFSDAGSLRAHALRAVEINADLGVTRGQWFSKDMREEFKARWEEADGDTRAGLIANFTAMQQPEVAKAMIRELGIADPMERMAALLLSQTGDRRTFLKAFRGQEALDAKTVKLPAAGEIDRVTFATLGPLLGPNVPEQAGIIALAKALYAADANGIDPEDKTAQEEAYGQALRTALGGEIAEIGAAPVLLPRGVDPARVEAALTRIAGVVPATPTRAQREGTVMAAPVVPREAVPLASLGTGGAPQVGGQPVGPEALRAARWVPAGDGLYTLEKGTHDGPAVPFFRDDEPTERWILDLRKLVRVP